MPIRIGNRTYPDDLYTTGSAAPPVRNIITDALHGYAAGIGKSANDLSPDELNHFISRWGAQAPNVSYKFPKSYD